jgi:nitrogen regulatory protein PII
MERKFVKFRFPDRKNAIERKPTMSDLTLHPMKEIRIIIEGEQLKFATDLLDNKATGYTVVHNISGKGHHGFHTSHPMFNEMDSIVMLMTVVTAENVEPILAGLKPLFARHTGVMFVSDVAVSRLEYFSTDSDSK